METGLFQKLLRDAIGLSQDTVGPTVIRHALRRRMTACGVGDLHDYWSHLTGNPVELQELIDAVIVPETWFFRDREAFGVAARHVVEHRRPGVPFRLLSVPCSTGEEPFSMAMALFGAGLEPQDFTIDAIDVSTRNLAYAKRAVFGRNSFRGDDLAFRERFFDAVDGGWRPHASILQQVRFTLGNLLDPALLPETRPSDIVFCRNLLIYFDREGQGQALDRLNQSLAPRGLLFVGPAESGLPSLHGFASARLPMAFAFTKAPAAPVVIPAPAKRRVVVPASTVRSGKPPSPPLPFAKKATPAADIAPAPDRAAASLAAIEQAANAGRLAEAKASATRHLKEFGPSPDAFYLLGLAHDADDAAGEAIANYRKALYLAPDHRQALAHLRLLLQRQGDAGAVAALTERLARIHKRSGT